jgi:hypothetical protein
MLALAVIGGLLVIAGGLAGYLRWDFVRRRNTWRRGDWD